MNKKLVLAAVIAMAPAAAMAAGENNVGSCGWGSKLWDGQSGVLAQISAATTNGTSGNQTFGVTTGSSGCTQNGTVKSNWKTSMFIDGNKEKLARDMSVGGGETLDSLASLIGVSAADKAEFVRAMQENFIRIYGSDKVSTQEIVVSLKHVLAESSTLAKYSAAI